MSDLERRGDLDRERRVDETDDMDGGGDLERDLDDDVDEADVALRRLERLEVRCEADEAEDER